MLGITDHMDHLCPGVTLHEFEQQIGRELGVVRISLGLASNFEDIHRVIQLASLIANSQTREAMIAEWHQSKSRASSCVVTE